MHLFRRTVTDEDMCFLRDWIDMLSTIAEIRSPIVWREPANKVLKEMPQGKRYAEFQDKLNYCDFKDCYPYRDEDKFKNLDAILSMITACEVKDDVRVISKATEIIKKAGLSTEYKKKLIHKYYIPEYAPEFVRDQLTREWLMMM